MVVTPDVGDAFRGFIIAGGKFIFASAVIEGSTVVVTSDRIAMPVEIRNGWTTAPDGNLSNRKGLPAVPFRTDAPANP
jgi:sialate O-acetylesterase